MRSNDPCLSKKEDRERERSTDPNFPNKLVISIK